ncbi:hypothetical protein B0T13DRAFT_529596 [Neurospora crassa]|nr:hypothetical protein B0T13DRAFT_529596 [Neurospora crassa]
MRLAQIIYLALASLAGIALAQDVLFPYMHGLKYSEYNETVKLGLSAHVCKDEAEWYNMTTEDFAKYKAIIVPDCLCNTSLNTIKFLDDTKKEWSPAVTGNMILIGTDPSFHAKWFGLPGAYAMMKDAISHVTLGNKDGTGMYFSLSCYYQSNSSQMTVQSLSEIGNFQVRGNLSHPCLNDAHLVATSNVMNSLNDGIASDWNCSVHEVFSDYPRDGSGGFNALAVAVNASGPGQQEFADGTVGIPYIIARGATPVGCGNNVTDTKFHEQCDEGKANGTPESLCSASCKCIYGMISPGVCRPKDNTASTTTSHAPSSTISSNSRPVVTVTASLPSGSVTENLTFIDTSTTPSSTGPETDPITVTVFPSSPSSPSSVPPTVTVTPLPASSSVTSPSNSSSISYGNGTSPLEPPRPPPTVTVFPSEDPSGSPPRTVTVEPSSPSNSGGSLSPSPSGSGPVTVTVLPPAQSANGTSPQSLGSSSSQPVSGPVTVTAFPPSLSGSPPPSSVPSQAGNSSSAPLAQSSGDSALSRSSGPVTVTASGSGRPNNSDGPSSPETATADLGTGSASSSPVGSASGSGTTSRGPPSSPSSSGPQSGAPPVTVTAQPPDQPIVSSQSPGGGSLSGIPGSSGPGSLSDSPGVPSSQLSASRGQVTVTAQPSAQSSVQPSSGVSGGTGGGNGGSNPGSLSSQPDGSSPSSIGSGPNTAPQSTVTVIPSASGEPDTGGPDTSGNPGAMPPSSSEVTATNSGQYSSSTSADTQTASGDPFSASPSSGAGAGAGAGAGSGSASQFSSPRPPFSNQTATVTYSGRTVSSLPGSQTTENSGSSSGAGSLSTATATPVPASGSGTATIGASSISAGGESSNGNGSGSGNSGSVTGSAQAPGATGTGSPSNGGSGAGGSLTLSPSGPISSEQPVSNTASGAPSMSLSSLSSGSSVSGSGSSGDSLTATSVSGSASATTLPGLPSGWTLTRDPANTHPGSAVSTGQAGGGTGNGSGSVSGTTLGVFPSSAAVNGTNTRGSSSSVSTGAGSGGVGTGSPISSGSDVTSPFPTATPVGCDRWIGVEIIYMVEEIEVCPEGATVVSVTITTTSTTATMSRSICKTLATNFPCYPCIMGTPASSDDSFTVTRTSCTTATEPTVTVTFRPCSTCTTSIYTGTVPGHTPGGPCHACGSYGEPDATSTVTVMDPGVGRPSSEVWLSALNPTTIATRPTGPAASVSSESECTTPTLVGVGGGYPGPAVSVSETPPVIVPSHTDPPTPGNCGNEHAPAGYTYGPHSPLDDPTPSGSPPGVPGAPGSGEGGVLTGDSHRPAMTPASTPEPDPVVVTNTAVPFRPTTAAGAGYGPVLAGAPGLIMKARHATSGVVLGLFGYIVMILLS